MTVYVAEIKGRGIAAFNADDPEAWLEDDTGQAFKEDLLAFQLWDGEEEIFMREAFPEEADQWRASLARAKLAGDVDADDDWLVFLVAVNESSDV